MVEGLYSAAAGMAAQQAQLAAIGNDIANVDTAGYQAQRTGFRDLLYQPAGGFAGASVLDGSGAAMETVGLSATPGSLQKTGRALDVAVQGNAYLEVKLANGSTALTRNGALSIDGRGQLVTADGAIVQPPIRLPAGTNENDLTIGSDGTVSANGKRLGRLALVTVPSPDHLLAVGKSDYQATAASGAIRAAGTGASLVSGALTGSNVDLSSALVDMMNTQRSYALDSRAITLEQQMMQTAVAVKR